MAEPIFGGCFRGCRVLVTGHTGFKGAWLARWLLGLGAEVTGLALAPATTPNLSALLGLEGSLRHRLVDVRDVVAVQKVVAEACPQVVFHLAAQPLVRLAYREPRATWEVNVGGTVNLLEAVRAVGGVRACVVVTSDKCYENREWERGYREDDALGGHDPYSSSKGAVELAVASWRRSFFQDPSGCRLASARAGNVIGGGDWSADRIVVDAVAALAAGRELVLRNSQAVRPWQHVLEPLSGYLDLAARLCGEDGQRFAGAWNFGPEPASTLTVGDLAARLAAAWGSGRVVMAGNVGQPHEAGILRLDCAKARAQLGWHGVWDIDQTVAATVSWFRGQLAGVPAERLVAADLDRYLSAARSARLPWIRPSEGPT